MSQWKERKSKWAILSELTGGLIHLNSVVALYPTRAKAKEMLDKSVYHKSNKSNYRLVRVWIKYDQVLTRKK